MKTIVLALLLATNALATFTVTVLGTTNTQAVLHFIPDGASCSIKISTTPSTYVPLAHDVDPTLFLGADQCNRSSSMVRGLDITMVLGARWADWDSNGTWKYSRALQAATTYYYQITSTSVVTGSFVTSNIPMGRTFFDTLPADTIHGPGYKLPMFTSQTDQTETVIDPLTGIPIRRIYMPRVLLLDKASATLLNNYNNALDSSGTWVTPANILVTTPVASTYATFTGTGSGTQPWLFLNINGTAWSVGVTPNAWNNGALSTDWLVHRLQGNISDGACVGDNCKIQVCMTIDGVDCWSQTIDGTLTGTDSAINFGQSAPIMNIISMVGSTGVATLSAGTCSDATTCLHVGDPLLIVGNTISTYNSIYTVSAITDATHITFFSVPSSGTGTGGTISPITMLNWKSAFSELLPLPYTGSTATTASISSGGLITWSAGDRWRPHWINGSWVQLIGGSNPWCQVNRVPQTGNQLQLQSTACATGAGITLPQASITVNGSNFGILIRKKTAKNDKISLSASNWKWGASANVAFVDTGSFILCGPTLVSGGYYCASVTPGNAWIVFWINPTTGAARLIGSFMSPVFTSTGSSLDNFNGGNSNADSFGTDTAGNLYMLHNDAGGRPIIIKATTAVTTQGLPQNTNTAMGSSCSPSTYSTTCSLNGIPSGITWTNMTPNSLSADLISQLVTFTTGEPNVFNTLQCTNYFISEVAGTKIKMHCRGAQNTPGWDFRLELGDGNPAHAGIGGTGPHIDAAADGTTYFPRRFSTDHAVLPTGEPTWVEHTLIQNSVSTTWKATLTDTSIPAYNALSPTMTLTIGTDVSDAVINLGGIQPGDFLCFNTVSTGYNVSTQEVGQVASRSGSSIVVNRGIGAGANPQAIAGPTTIYAWGVYGGWVPAINNSTTKIWWNMDSDPHAHNSSYSVSGGNPFALGPSLTVSKDAANSGAHQFYRAGLWVSEASGPSYCPVNGYNGCYQTALGTIPTFLSTTVPNITTHPESSSAGNFSGAASGTLTFQSHVGPAGVNAPSNQLKLFLDTQGFSPDVPQGTFALVSSANYLWKLTSTIANSSFPDDASGNFTVNRKRLATLMACGRYACQDVSGPSSVLHDTSADNYKYCYARVANECISGSSVGDVYVNMPSPSDSMRSPLSGNINPIGSCPGNGDRDQDVVGNLYLNTMCISNNGMFGMTIPQITGGVSDPQGALSRPLTIRLAKYATDSVFGNARLLPDNSWAMYQAYWVNDTMSALLMIQMPPLVSKDSAAKEGFINVTAQLASVPATTSTADVIFGYAEYGGNCTSRLELCEANSGTINQVSPFNYISTDTYSHLACSSGCTIAIPAISGRVLYWYPRYFNSVGTQIGGGPSYQRVVPVP